MDRYLSPSEVCDVIPGMTEPLLAQMRFRGDGPPFIKPSPKKVVYAEASLNEWLGSRERTQTGEGHPRVTLSDHHGRKEQ